MLEIVKEMCEKKRRKEKRKKMNITLGNLSNLKEATDAKLV